MEAILRKEIVTNKIARRLIGVFIFIILTALGAFVRIPLGFTPVPLTLQTFFVLLSGLFLGAGCAALSQLGYLVLGVMGVPLFTLPGSGSLYLLGPTGGYLFGFMAAAFTVGKFLKYTKDNQWMVFGLLCLADLLLLLCGAVWLKLISGYSLERALVLGFIPFLIGDLLKAWVATKIFMRLKARVREIF